MKKKNLKLSELKVTSFVTGSDQIMGGKIDTESTSVMNTRMAECDGKTIFGTDDPACNIKWTFMDADTGGCKFTDLGCVPTKTLPG